MLTSLIPISSGRLAGLICTAQKAYARMLEGMPAPIPDDKLNQALVDLNNQKTKGPRILEAQGIVNEENRRRKITAVSKRLTMLRSITEYAEGPVLCPAEELQMLVNPEEAIK